MQVAGGIVANDLARPVLPLVLGPAAYRKQRSQQQLIILLDHNMVMTDAVREPQVSDRQLDGGGWQVGSPDLALHAHELLLAGLRAAGCNAQPLRRLLHCQQRVERHARGGRRVLLTSV
jgi:hypothetical protein